MPGGVGLGALVNLPAGPFVPVAAGLARPNHPPGPVRRPILAVAVAVVLVVITDETTAILYPPLSSSAPALLEGYSFCLPPG